MCGDCMLLSWIRATRGPSWPIEEDTGPRATFGLSRGICCEWPTRAVGGRGPGIGDLPDQLRGDDSDLLSCRDVHLGAHGGAYPAPGKRGSLALAATCSGSSKALCAAGWRPSSANKTTLSLASQSTRPVAVQAVTKSERQRRAFQPFACRRPVTFDWPAGAIRGARRRRGRRLRG